MNDQQILKKVKQENVHYVQLQFTDLNGIVKSLTIPAQHLADCLRYGTWFDGSSIEGFARISESDMFLKPDTNTYAIIPWLQVEEGQTARFICDVYKPDGTPFEGDPRHILKRAIREAEQLGYEYNVGPELEFFLLHKTGNSVITPHDKASYFDYSTDRAYDIRRDMVKALERFGIEVEASHHEVAIGQHEIDFRFADALRTADNATTLRFVLKAVAEQHNLYATFMPKPIAGINGSGMHVHQSLFNRRTGKNIFYDAADPYGLSQIAYHFIAGQLVHVKAMSAILSPTVNSYKRLVPGYEAPVYLSWARTNRSALIRIPQYSKGKHQSTRAELRCPDPSCNIYLAFAVMLKAGLDGIKRSLKPPKPVEEDVYHFDDSKLAALKIDTLPDSLDAALKELKGDKLIQEALGQHTFERYVEAKTKEWDEYRLQVTHWELEKYLDIY
ncbi:MAG: glutamine synthetase [Acidobacteria bacterium RIFCSPLOWO2_02_FULL_59_13]|nr:MAG: glutamine synthetase [Acidobacteria bacterium RIFCSPLOWO2_02_FULL_59_13]